MEQEIYMGNPDKTLYILRGLPGAGKTTLANEIADLVFATDDFFEENGVLTFNPGLYAMAHAWNQERVYGALKSGKGRVAVDNTNCLPWEMKPYVEMGIENNYSISLVEPDSPHKWDVEILARVNSHRIPAKTIQKMLNRFQYNVSLEQILSANSKFVK